MEKNPLQQERSSGGPGLASTVGSELPTHPKDLGCAGAEMDVGTAQKVCAGFGYYHLMTRYEFEQ